MGWNAQPTRAVIFQDVRVPVGKPAGPGRHRLQDRDGRTRRRPAQHCGLFARRRPGRAGKVARLHERAQGLRQTPRRVPGPAVPPRRYGHRARGVAHAVVASGSGARPQGCERHAALRHGQAFCHRHRASTSPIRRCNCTAATATCRNSASRRSCAICACTRFSRAPTRSCVSSWQEASSDDERNGSSRR